MNTAPPKIADASAIGSRRVVWLLALALLAGVAMVYFFNPTSSRFYPACHFHQLTGLNCPGCGMTRAAHALLHGDLAAALRDNALFVGTLALLGWRGAWFEWNRRRGVRNGAFLQGTWLWPLLVAALVFTVLRNLPAFGFLSPP